MEYYTDDEEERDNIRDLEKVIEREEEAKQRAREELEGKLRQEAHDREMAKLEHERQIAAMNVYRKKMEENKKKLLERAIFGS